jgi:hypothetical protein
MLPMVHDANEYSLIRNQLLPQATASEHARAKRVASQMDYNQINSSVDTLVRSKLLKRQQKQQANSLIIHYTHEQRFVHYKSAIHRMWANAFQSTPIMNTLLIVGTCNNPNITRELIRLSPFSATKIANNNNKQSHTT